MLTFIATIFIVYLIWLLVKPILLNYARRRYQEKVNDMFNQAFRQTGSYTDGFGQSGRRNAGYSQKYPRQKRKIFSRDEGEYIEFEEIDVKEDYSSTSHSDPSYTPREPQVSDADWEEIR